MTDEIRRQDLIDLGFEPESGHDRGVFWVKHSKGNSVRMHASFITGGVNPYFSVMDANIGPIPLLHLKSLNHLKVVIEVLL